LTASILDQPERFAKIDKNQMILYPVQAVRHYVASAKASKTIKLTCTQPVNIVIVGMGGSAIGGELLKDYTRSTSAVPVEISREYHLPAYADSRTLAILASYSGDTEETLSSFVDALKRKCIIFCVSSGGALIEYAQKLNVPCLQVEGGMPPRAALPHMLMPLLRVMETLSLMPSVEKEFDEATKVLEKVSKDNAPEKPTATNSAKSLAVNLYGTCPVVYGFGAYRGVALRYKQQFNENSKLPAKWEAFSELNHNETMGWANPKELAQAFSVVFLRDKAEPVEIRSRIETTQALMKPAVSRLFEVYAQGKSTLAKMLSTILIGDFTSVYLAYLRGVDPTPVDTVTVMKQKIEQNGVKKKVMRELEELSK
jgi:glucose/mannose-6-phosphate isomerase